MKITTVGIYLAKNVFSMHGIDGHGKAVMKRTASRSNVMEVMGVEAPLGRAPLGAQTEQARACREDHGAAFHRALTN